MNTEIFDYLKALSKKEFFYVNLINCICSAVIIISGFISLKNGTSMRMYAIMFAMATVILSLNCYKCFIRKSKNAWIFMIFAVIFLAITALAFYACIGG